MGQLAGPAPGGAGGAWGRILVVDDDPSVRAFLLRGLSRLGFACDGAAGAEEALERLEVAARSPRPSAPAERPTAGPLPPVEPRLEVRAPGEYGLVIADLRMPGRDGLWLLSRLRERYPDLAVIMLTALDDSRTAVECLRRGATDYLVKPIEIDQLVVAVHLAFERQRLMVENRAYRLSLERMVTSRTEELESALARLERSYGETLAALAAALDAREQETAYHSERVAGRCVQLVQRLGVADREQLRAVQHGALLHDIGKIGIPDHILRKPGPLTAQEWEIMRRHPRIGYEILRRIEFLEPALDLVLHHQERYDGSGYPDGLATDAIPLAARAFAVVDAWDAMTHQRPYRPALPEEAARRELLGGSGTQFDPAAVAAFLELLGAEPLPGPPGPPPGPRTPGSRSGGR